MRGWRCLPGLTRFPNGRFSPNIAAASILPPTPSGWRAGSRGKRSANIFPPVSRKRKAAVEAVPLPALQPHSETEVAIEITPSHRGVIRLTGLTIARSGPFGLYHACKTVVMAQSVLILPKRYELPPVDLSGSRRYQSGGVALASSVGDSEEFVSLRDYRPGDPLRRIHWKSWAKVGKPVVKEYQDEFFLRHALILDTFSDAAYSEALEQAVSIAASFTCQIQNQDTSSPWLGFCPAEAISFRNGIRVAPFWPA